MLQLQSHLPQLLLQLLHRCALLSIFCGFTFVVIIGRVWIFVADGCIGVAARLEVGILQLKHVLCFSHC